MPNVAAEALAYVNRVLKNAEEATISALPKIYGEGDDLARCFLRAVFGGIARLDYADGAIITSPDQALRLGQAMGVVAQNTGDGSCLIRVNGVLGGYLKILSRMEASNGQLVRA